MGVFMNFPRLWNNVSIFLFIFYPVLSFSQQIKKIIPSEIVRLENRLLSKDNFKRYREAK